MQGVSTPARGVDAPAIGARTVLSVMAYQLIWAEREPPAYRESIACALFALRRMLAPPSRAILRPKQLRSELEEQIRHRQRAHAA